MKQLQMKQLPTTKKLQMTACPQMRVMQMWDPGHEGQQQCQQSQGGRI